MKRIATIIAAITIAIAIIVCAIRPTNQTTITDRPSEEVILDSDTGLGIDENTVLWTPNC